jgi:hypothetical protein
LSVFIFFFFSGEKRLLLLLRDHNAPGVADIAVHDVADPSLDLGGDDVGGVFGAHGDVDILAAVVDGGNGADKVLGGNALASQF